MTLSCGRQMPVSNVIGNGHLRRPGFETTLDKCHMFTEYAVHAESSRYVTDLDIVCVIG